VFVHHSVHIDIPIFAVSSALARGAGEWFPRFEEPSLAAVGPQVAGIGIRKKVAIEFGEPVTVGTWTQVPITWKATTVHKLFPVMTGKIELEPVDSRNTRLTVCGMYEAPLGRLGKHLDDALMHKVAQATVKDLAESIAERLEALVRSDTWS
jgi:hypothetical protein